VPKINLMDNTTTHHLKYHFLAIFAPFTPSLSINGINTPIRHDPTNLTPFRANMSEIRRMNIHFWDFINFRDSNQLSIGCYIMGYILDVIFWVIFLTLQNYFYDDRTDIYKITLDFYKLGVINSNSYLEIKKGK
jgi:hypothetical protein